MVPTIVMIIMMTRMQAGPLWVATYGPKIIPKTPPKMVCKMVRKNQRDGPKIFSDAFFKGPKFFANSLVLEVELLQLV